MVKALTIWQPYASWIVDGAKLVENRTWVTQYRGPLVIHAGVNEAEVKRLKCQAKYPLGYVLGTVDLVACETLAKLRSLAETEGDDYRLPGSRQSLVKILEHNHTLGPVCWILENAQKFEQPISAIGKQGLWDWEPQE